MGCQQKGVSFMKKFFLNPVVTFLIGMLVSATLFSSGFDKLASILPVMSLSSIIFFMFIKKCEEAD